MPPVDVCNKGRYIYQFSGNQENFIKNGEALLEERISLFDGKTNSICCFSVDDLNSMNVNNDFISTSINNKSFRGVWDGKSVLVKIYCIDPHFNDEVTLTCREIAVVIQMGTHRNVHRLLGCCLHTNHPVLVYEWEEKGNLMNRITNYKEQSNETLEWKDRLRIVWEIAHAVAYLHTAFRRPIIHRGLIPGNVYLDQENSARLSDFGLSISIPEGKKHVDDMVIGVNNNYVAPEYVAFGRVTKSLDVFAFGGILLVLLTGCSHYPRRLSHFSLVGWVSECREVNCLNDVVDPTITKNGLVADEHFDRQLKALVELTLSCLAEDQESCPQGWSLVVKTWVKLPGDPGSSLPKSNLVEHSWPESMPNRLRACHSRVVNLVYVVCRLSRMLGGLPSAHQR